MIQGARVSPLAKQHLRASTRSHEDRVKVQAQGPSRTVRQMRMTIREVPGLHRGSRRWVVCDHALNPCKAAAPWRLKCGR